MAFIGTLQKRTFMDDLASGMQAGAPLAQMLQGKQQQKEEQEKQLIQFIMTQYQNTDEEGRRAMEADPNWAQFQALMAKHGLSTMMPGGKMVMPAEKPETLEQLKAKTYGTLPLEEQQDIVTGKEEAPFEPKKHGYQWALEQYQQGNRDPEILKLVFQYEAKEAKEVKKDIEIKEDAKHYNIFVDGVRVAMYSKEQMPQPPIVQAGKLGIFVINPTTHEAKFIPEEAATKFKEEELEIQKIGALSPKVVAEIQAAANIEGREIMAAAQKYGYDLTLLTNQQKLKLQEELGWGRIELDEHLGKLQKQIAEMEEAGRGERAGEEIKVKRERLKLDWSKLETVDQVDAATNRLKVEAEDKHKGRELENELKAIAQKAGEAELVHSLGILNNLTRGSELESLESWRNAMKVEGADKLKLLRETLDQEDEHFTATHRLNIGKDSFFRKMSKRIQTTAERRLVLDEWTAYSNETIEEAKLEQKRLTDMYDYLVSQAELAQGAEQLRLTDQANRTKQFIADYEKEIAVLEQKRKDAETANKIWESEQLTPAKRAEMEARTKATIDKMGRPELVTLKPGETLFEYKGRAEKPLTQLKEMPADPEKQKNILRELMATASSAAGVGGMMEWGTEEIDRYAEGLRALIEVDRRLPEEIKALYKSYISKITGSALVAGLEGEGGIVPVPGSITLDEFVEIFRSATEGKAPPSAGVTSQIAQVAEEAMRIYREQGIDASEKYAQSQGFTLDQIASYLKKTRKK